MWLQNLFSVPKNWTTKLDQKIPPKKYVFSRLRLLSHFPSCSRKMMPRSPQWVKFRSATCFGMYSDVATISINSTKLFDVSMDQKFPPKKSVFSRLRFISHFSSYSRKMMCGSPPWSKFKAETGFVTSRDVGTKSIFSTKLCDVSMDQKFPSKKSVFHDYDLFRIFHRTRGK